jgi:hypothetical protein
VGVKLLLRTKVGRDKIFCDSKKKTILADKKYKMEGLKILPITK